MQHFRKFLSDKVGGHPLGRLNRVRASVSSPIHVRPTEAGAGESAATNATPTMKTNHGKQTHRTLARQPVLCQSSCHRCHSFAVAPHDCGQRNECTPASLTNKCVPIYLSHPLTVTGRER